ncbi:MAG: hypothetical protein JNJ45_08785 [Chthonomonas sp.]|nr:hypothetical protein [Chthonomonas sp.]
MKKIITVSLVAISALVFAQQGGPAPVAATHGRGVAQSEDGRRGEFKFEAVKMMRENQARVRGNAEFTQVRTETVPGVKVSVREVALLGAQGNVAEFGGPAIIILPPATVGGQPRRVEGRANFRVVDRAQPNGGADQAKDLYRIHFENQNQSLTFDFQGAVQRGDLVVRVNNGGGN